MKKEEKTTDTDKESSESEKADEVDSPDPEEELRIERENVEQLKAQLLQMTSEKESWMNKYYTSLADVQNLRKDIQRDSEKARKFAAEPILRKLIPFMQSMDQAFRYEPTDDPKSASWIKGIHLAYRQLTKALEELEIREIDPKIGSPFDAYTMEAMGTVEGDKPDLVGDVLMKGFTLHDRLIQPASVLVTVPRTEEREDTGEEREELTDDPKEDATESD